MYSLHKFSNTRYALKQNESKFIKTFNQLLLLHTF